MRYFGSAALASMLASIGACDRDRETSAAAPTSVSDPLPRGAPDAPQPDAPAPDVAPPAPPTLAIGDRLAPVSSLGSVPRLLVVGSAEALARGETWRDLDAMARLYADNGLVSLAIVVTHANGTPTPPKDPSATTTQIDAARKRGRITMPFEIATDTAALVGVGTDPCVVLVDGGDVVRFVGGAGAHWRDLDRAIGSLLAAK